MQSLSYQQFIDDINSGKIIKAVFQVKDYAHYRCCSIERIVDIFPNGNSMVRIDVKLAKSYYVGEYGHIVGHFGFFGKFKEDRKLFKMGRNGTFTLKQMWDRIEFTSIDYANK
ncbi:MAG: hypothetical protein K2O28_06520 [Clostridia bacterium]|nr:hypothetical protein [Clostridia bacterium]